MGRRARLVNNQGVTLLEVVITVTIVGFIVLAASQLLRLITTGNEASVADPGGYISGQRKLDEINFFLGRISRDFRMAKKVIVNDSPPRITFSTSDNRKVQYSVRNGRLLCESVKCTLIGDVAEVYVRENHVQILDGIEEIRIVLEKHGSFFSKLYAVIRASGGVFDLSIVRRNPPEGEE